MIKMIVVLQRARATIIINSFNYHLVSTQPSFH